VRARPEQAPYFSRPGQIAAIPGPEGEQLPLARLETGQSGQRARAVLDGDLGRGRRARRQLVRRPSAAGAGRRGNAGQPGGLIGMRRMTPGAADAVGAVGRNREPVGRIRPPASLVGILAGRLNLRRQRGQLMTATLTDHRERLPVQHQTQRDLIRPASPVMARDRYHAEQRSIYAA